MKTKYLIYIVITLILLIFIFSVFKISENTIYKKNEEVPSYNKNVKVVIPVSEKKYYQFIVAGENQLNIKPLINKPNSIGIRFWLYPHTGSPSFLISMNLYNGQWSGKLYLFQYLRRNKQFSNIQSMTISPKTNWNNIINRVSHYGIFVLPDSHILNLDEDKAIKFNYGPSYLIETIDSTYYRFYRYYAPDLYIDESFECENVENISQVLFYEFDVLNKFGAYRKRLIK